MTVRKIDRTRVKIGPIEVFGSGQLDTGALRFFLQEKRTTREGGVDCLALACLQLVVGQTHRLQ